MPVAGVQSYAKSFPITKSDTVNFEYGISDAIYVGGAGVVVVVYENGQTASITAVAGALLPIRAKRVNDTNTTATVMQALYYRPEGNTL